MPALIKPRQEAFAQAMADGANYKEAAARAGYTRNGKRLADNSNIKERIDQIRRARIGGGSREFGALMNELVATAFQARDLDTAQGMTAAKGLFELVGRYKDKLPDPNAASAPAATAVLHPDDEDLSEEEWTARYGPEAPGWKTGWK